MSTPDDPLDILSADIQEDQLHVQFTDLILVLSVLKGLHLCAAKKHLHLFL